MKTLIESILGDINTVIDDSDKAIKELELLQGLFHLYKKDISITIDNFKLALDNANAKIHKTTNRIKTSDKFFIQIPHNPGYTYDFILIKRYGSNWYVFTIDIDVPKIYNLRIESWQSLQPNLSPKITYLYEVPEHMNGLCDKILNNAEKYR